MKKQFILIALALTALVGCQEDKSYDEFVSSVEGAAVRLQIDLQSATPGSRAVEGGHTATTTPEILSATLYAYNQYGVKTEIDILDATSLGKLKNGQEFEVGLPAGTTKIDVVLNNPATKYTDISTNINHYNHKNDVGDEWMNGDQYIGKDNFERVFITSDYYNTGGIPLQGNVVDNTKEGEIPTYTLKDPLVLKPNLARFEVFNAINVANETAFVDKWNIKWKRYATGGSDQITTDIEADFPSGVTSNVSTTGVIKDEAAGFYYIPQYYWKGTGDKTANPGTANADWAANTFYDRVTEEVTWLPNLYYAVDVEEVFINNILVREATAKSPFLMDWPGAADQAKNWPNWYKAYHLDGWHPKGVSADNTFLCMGNMWDRIAVPASGVTDTEYVNVDFTGLNIPPVEGGSGQLTMQVIKGKSAAVTNKSEFADKANNRNLGIKSGSAAAYMLYAQSKGATTSETAKDALMSELPHVVLKVKCYKTKDDYAKGNAQSDKNYITLKLFANTIDSAYITQFVRSKIYRLDLNDLVSIFKGEKPFKDADIEDPSDPVDPDPEMPGSKLTLKVTVENWTIENMKPVI